jgi:Transglutaminase-like superfamily
MKAARRWADCMLAAEALGWLLIAGAAIRLAPFRAVGALASRPVGGSARRRPPVAGRVAWAVQAAVARLPWSPACFEQALAAQVMLRRRGVASTLFYGAKPDRSRGVQAHVWVREDDRDVIGCEASIGYAVLATFPARGAGR